MSPPGVTVAIDWRFVFSSELNEEVAEEVELEELAGRLVRYHSSLGGTKGTELRNLEAPKRLAAILSSQDRTLLTRYDRVYVGVERQESTHKLIS